MVRGYNILLKILRIFSKNECNYELCSLDAFEVIFLEYQRFSTTQEKTIYFPAYGTLGSLRTLVSPSGISTKDCQAPEAGFTHGIPGYQNTCFHNKKNLLRWEDPLGKIPPPLLFSCSWRWVKTLLATRLIRYMDLRCGAVKRILTWGGDWGQPIVRFTTHLGAF